MSEQASSDIVLQRHLVVRAVLRTDTGLVRSENQDFGACTTASEEEASHTGGRLLIVADGMGGHRGGATASRLAAETVKQQYLGSGTTDIAAALREALTRANATIFSEAQSNPELRGMGTTTSVLAVRGDHGWLAHVGDSRIYLVRGDEIRQLTDDHSLVATMVREGLLTTAEAETHPRRNVLQRSMGVSEEVEVDVRGPIRLQEGDTFILCSDGLHGVVKENELKEIAKGSIEAAADEYVRLALERGAPDNVTVIVARVEVSTDPREIALAEKWEETQPLEPFGMDETRKEAQEASPEPAAEDRDITAKIVAVETGAQTPAGPPPAVAVAPPPPPAPRPAARTPTASRTPIPPRPGVPAKPVRRRSFVSWMVVLVVVLAAAGAWFYWSHQRSLMEGTVSSSR